MNRLYRVAGPTLLALGIVLLLPHSTKALNPNHSCAFCHGLHGGDLIIQGDTNVENMCLSCHDGTTSQLTAAIHINRGQTDYAPFRATCLRCHDPHDTDPDRSGAAFNWLGTHTDDSKPSLGTCNVSKDACSTLADCQAEDNECILWKEGINIKLVGGAHTAQVQTWELDPNNDGTPEQGPQCEQGQDFTGILDNECYVSGARDLVFEQRGTARDRDGEGPAGKHSFADFDRDANGTYDGVCEICHTRTTHHRNDGNEPSPGHHDGRACPRCHAHADNFLP